MDDRSADVLPQEIQFQRPLIPVMKKDIESTTDIELLVNAFYEKVKTDPSIGPFFKNTIWEKHLPVMYKFWENAIFYSGGYTGNPLNTHKHIHERSPLSKDHFNIWIHLFLSTVDELFSGEKATIAKQRAISVSTVMQIKIC
jgi:hemoglobin